MDETGIRMLPNAPPVPPALADELRAAVQARGPEYQPRTRHRQPDGAPMFTNRLMLEPSPYLQQHAHNPVNWYPWGEEAFAAAKRLGRPILLSVGYSTCHWCHVMEEESFEDLDIARYLNAHYIPIKVDREELPDVDSIYMAAVLRIKGSGGWPMTVWLTPEREPFHGDTYIPPRAGARRAAVGFIDLLQRFSDEYQRSPDTIVARSARLTREIQQMKTPPIGGTLERGRAETILIDAAARYRERFDRRHGGARGAPKFPSTFPVRLLLRLHRRTRDPELLSMATATLEAMARGGIYDHIGGGFHRYTVDERWLVPHFEKMLYDNALLTMAYLEGFQATGRADFAEVARETLAYVAREMTAPQGGFYSATDADSLNQAGHREEGAFFVWTPAQVAAALAPNGRADGEANGEANGEVDDLALATALFGVTPGGNFEGKNILYRPRTLAEVAAELGLSEDAARARLPAIKQALYQARARRSPPARDDKILVAWNGLMISAFARAARVLDSDAPARSAYLAQAARAADFILGNMRRDDGLWRSYVDGQAHVLAYLDDYAFFINGLLDLFEAGGDARYLEHAQALEQVVARRFEDRERGGFFLSGEDHDALLAREKPSYDGAIPSGTSVAVMVLLRLAELTSDEAYRQRADRAIASLAGLLQQAPQSMPELLLALDFATDTVKAIVIVVPGSAAAMDQAAPFTRVLGRMYLPNAVTRVLADQDTEAMARLMPLVQGKIAQRGQTTAYVCEQQHCELPARDPELFARQLDTYAPLAGGSSGAQRPDRKPPASTTAP